AKPFPIGYRADPTLDIDLFADHIVPDAIDRVDINRVPSEGRDVCDSRIEIHGPYRMPLGLLLIDYRLVILPIHAVLPFVGAVLIISPVPAFVDKEFGQLQIRRTTRNAV